uniref:Odorant receptor n=1 Tax=Glossina brevipalpis TaxID=37001 RepID=A0A1A9WHR7_9MUSC
MKELAVERYLIAIMISMGGTSYAMHLAVIRDNDWIVIVRALCLLVKGFQACFKMIAMFYPKEVRDVTKILDDIYSTYQSKGKAFEIVLTNRMGITLRVQYIILSFYALAYVVLMFAPIASTIIYGEKEFITPFVIPGINPFSNNGYIITYGMVLFLSTLACISIVCGTLGSIIYLVNVPLFKDILKLKFQDYLRKVDRIYSLDFFFELGGDFLSVVSSLFIMFISKWPAAYANIFICMFTIYAYCFMGNLVTKTNDEIISMIYTEFLWYKLSSRHQKAIQVMLLRAQHPVVLTAGKIGPLSLVTAMQLSKSTYSVLMFKDDLKREQYLFTMKTTGRIKKGNRREVAAVGFKNEIKVH